MKIYKRTLVRLFFAIEIIVFITVYMFGSNGLQFLRRLQEDNNRLVCHIADLQKKIDSLQQEISDWQSSDFFKEKVARENLQMAKSGDQIYFLK